MKPAYDAAINLNATGNCGWCENLLSVAESGALTNELLQCGRQQQVRLRPLLRQCERAFHRRLVLHSQYKTWSQQELQKLHSTVSKLNDEHVPQLLTCIQYVSPGMMNS